MGHSCPKLYGFSGFDPVFEGGGLEFNNLAGFNDVKADGDLFAFFATCKEDVGADDLGEDTTGCVDKEYDLLALSGFEGDCFLFCGDVGF